MNRIARDIKNWKWWAGMREAKWGERYHPDSGAWWDKIPNIYDPATQGWMSYQCRGIYGPEFFVCFTDGQWKAWSCCMHGFVGETSPILVGETRGEVLLAAIEAAP